MAKSMKIIASVALTVTVLFAMIYPIQPVPAFLTIAITAGTIAYHFGMRLLVGRVFHAVLKNRVDYTRKWFQVGRAEQKIYRFLKVKSWKRFLPTYDPDTFDKQKHSWHEIAGATCQSELVHETIVLLSFVPIAFSLWFGELAVFIVTSVASALFDLLFVMIQRYNRPRVLKLIRYQRR